MRVLLKFKIKTNGLRHYNLNASLCSYDFVSSAKGQLISKCPFGVFKSSKKPMKFFPGLLPYPLKRVQIKKIRELYTTNWRILCDSYTTFLI